MKKKLLLPLLLLPLLTSCALFTNFNHEKHEDDFVNKEIDHAEFTPPTKKTYKVGDSFDPTGMEYVVHYVGENEPTVIPNNRLDIEGFNTTRVKSDVEVNVYYKKTLAGSFNINVLEAGVEYKYQIHVENEGETVEYFAGESFEYSLTVESLDSSTFTGNLSCSSTSNKFEVNSPTKSGNKFVMTIKAKDDSVDAVNSTITVTGPECIPLSIPVKILQCSKYTYDVSQSYGSYSSNYGNFYNNDKNIVYKRTGNDYEGYTVIRHPSLLNTYSYFAEGLGFIGNGVTSPIHHIKTIKLSTEYIEPETINESARIGTSANFGESEYFNYLFSTGEDHYNFYAVPGNPSYFRIYSAKDSDLTLYSLEIYYDGRESAPISTNNGYSGTGEYRFEAPIIPSSLAEGTMIEMPYSYDKSTHQVTSYHTYKYYSVSYLESNTYLVSQNVYTDPVDVCNYVIAFGQWPINYAYSSQYSDRTSIGVSYSDFRCVSEYNWTTGYVTKVPAAGVDTSSFHYYELDVDLDGTYTKSSRGAGRIVWFPGGFNTYENYGGGVCVFTDDHYATFQEYLNTGAFTKSFNVQEAFTNCVHGFPTTQQSAYTYF